MIAKLKVNHCGDRSDLVAILAVAGYKVSIKHDRPMNTIGGGNYFVIVEEAEDDAPRTD